MSLTHARLCARTLAAATLAALLAISGVVGIGEAGANNNPLVISMSASPSPVSSGEQLTYTIVVLNDGGAKVTEVGLTDVVNGLTGVDGTNNLVLTSTVGSCAQSGNSVTCDAGTLAGRQTWTVTIRGVVTAANGTVLHNTATVTGSKSATTFTSSTTVSTQVTGGGPVAGDLADLAMSIDAPAATPLGSDFIYSLTVDNKGSANTTDVEVIATLPSQATFQAVEATSLFACSHDLPPGEPGGTVTCVGGAVNAGSNATIRIAVKAPAVEGASLTSSAVVDPFSAIEESNEFNNQGQATTKVTDHLPQDTLAITKTDNPDPVVPYQELTYTTAVTNTAARRADYVTVTDGTQGLDAASVRATANLGGECVVEAPKVTCSLRRLQPGEVFEVIITGTVIEPPSSKIINIATVIGNIQNKGHIASAPTVTTVRPGIDLTVTAHRTFPAPPEPVRAADRFDYTLTAGNSGLFNANNVVVRQPLPDGVFFDVGLGGGGAGGGPGFDASAAGTTCNVNVANVLTCTIPQVRGANASGQIEGTTETITLKLVAPQAIGPITSTVTVDPANAIPESDETNNTYTITTNVLTGIDLTVSAVENFDPIARNGTLRYTITVPNEGTQDTSGVVVRSVLPAGTVFRSAQGTHNLTCSHSSGVVTCLGGIIRGTYSGSTQLPVDAATITIDAFAPDEPGLIHFETRVDPDNTIPEILEDNNIAFVGTAVENGEANGSYKELSIPDIAVNHDPIATSGTLDYTLTILNTGSADAFNVEVEAKLPAGAIYRSANDLDPTPGQFTCAQSGGVVRCNGGTVTGSDGTRKILVSVFAPPDPGTALLEAMVDPENKIGEADEANNHADKSVVVQAGSPNGVYIDLRVKDITDNHDPVAPDGTLEYAVTIENLGAADAFNVQFRATLPTGSRFRFARDDVAGPDAFTCDYSDGVVNCIGGRVNNGAARVVHIGVFAPSTPATYRLHVLVDPYNDIPEGNEGNNAAEETTAVQLGGGGGFIDLQIAITDPPATVIPGEEIAYEVKVSNAGTDDAFNVATRIALPTDATFVSVSASAGSNFLCQRNGGVVDCTGGYVKGSQNGGGDRVITVKVKAPLVHDVDIFLQAFVDPFNAIAEADETNNSDQKGTKVFSKIDLTVSNDPKSTPSGQEGFWEFSAIMDGPGEASNVTVVTTLPVGVVPQDVKVKSPTTGDNSSWFCQITENPVNQVTCTASRMTQGTVVFEVRLFVTAQSGKSLSSTTVIDPDNVVIEHNPDNNTAQGATTA